MSVNMKDYMTPVQAVRMGPVHEIPVIDLAPFRNGEARGLEDCAAELRHALENVGFYLIVNHGVPQDTIDRAYRAVRQFFALPDEVKMALLKNEHNIGYAPIRSLYNRPTSTLNNERQVRSAAESLFMKADLAPDHPDVLAGKRFRAPNQWPPEAVAPGFRDAMVTYARALEALGKSLLPLYATALELPVDWFDRAFVDPMYTLRISRYPRQATLGESEQGLPPHTDTSFMTLLPHNRVQGLQVRLSDGRWVDAPSVPGSFVVNSGNMLRRWSNNRCMSTPHQVVNLSPEERYAMPFFLDVNRDWLMDCIPTCMSADKPFEYEPITYGDYMSWYTTDYVGASKKS
ncbi:isopenicillin N synthase family dioxygenase [Reyranella sp.]|uniref:isopenicillin N synthase family dioxygenase n=1 Tax=Reyranella sp. TaxID=1929291 RepID=UPI003BABEDCD